MYKQKKLNIFFVLRYSEMRFEATRTRTNKNKKMDKGVVGVY